VQAPGPGARHAGDSRWPVVLQILHALHAAALHSTEPHEVESRLHGLRAGTATAAGSDFELGLLAATAEGRCLDRLGNSGQAEEILPAMARSARAAGYDWLFLLATDLAATAAAHGGNWLHVAMLETEMATATTGGRPVDQVTGRAMLYAMMARYERCQALDPGVLEVLLLRELPFHQAVAEIARKRNVSQNTAKTHLRNIYQKLEAKNRAEAVTIARDRGLL
jgi:LuxR family maltose regulon positive regulatory protein